MLDLPERERERELAVALDSFADTGLLFRRGTAADASYVFKHALVQDAAFQTLLLTTRKEYHGGIARALETGFPETDRCSTAVAGAALRASGAVGVRAAILAQGRCIRAVASRQP